MGQTPNGILFRLVTFLVNRITIGKLLSCGIALGAALTITSVSRGVTPLDRALPLLVGLVAVASFLFSSATTAAGSVAPPLLILAAISIPEPRMRLFVYGVIFVVAMVLQGVTLLSQGSLRGVRGTLLLALSLIPLRLFAGSETVWWRTGDLLIFAGALLVYLSLQVPRESAPENHRARDAAAFGVAFLAGAFSLAEPSSAALFPLVLAMCIVGGRASQPWTSLGLLAFTLAVGLWAVPIAVVSVVSQLARVAVSRWTSPSSWYGTLRKDGQKILMGVAATGLVLTGFLSRPALTGYFLIAAMALLVHAGFQVSILAALTLGGSVIALTLLAWSGALPALFVPLFSILLAVTLVAVLIQFLGHKAPAAAAVILAGLFGAAILLKSAHAGDHFGRTAARSGAERVEVVGEAIRAGESIDLRFGGRSARVSLDISMANGANFKRGTEVGVIQTLDTAGRGYETRLRVGDVADWGVLRQGWFFRSRHGSARIPGGNVHGFGKGAYLEGAGRVEIVTKAPIGFVRIRASPGLAPSAVLQVERVTLFTE